MKFRQKIIILGILCFLNCADTNDLYYSATETNARIIVAYAIKDFECNSKHTIKAYIPGEARKTEVDACVQAVLTRICGDWKVSDPTPLLCKTINYRTNYKLRGVKNL